MDSRTYLWLGYTVIAVVVFLTLFFSEDFVIRGSFKYLIKLFFFGEHLIYIKFSENANLTRKPGLKLNINVHFPKM